MTVVDDNGKKFPIEISKHEYVDEKVAEIVDDLTVYAYSPQMLVAEKLRAICQQMPEYTELLEETREPTRKGLPRHSHGRGTLQVDFGDPGFHQTARKGVSGETC